MGKRLLKHLNILDQITVPDNEFPDNEVSDFDLIDMVAKSKHLIYTSIIFIKLLNASYNPA